MDDETRQLLEDCEYQLRHHCEMDFDDLSNRVIIEGNLTYEQILERGNSSSYAIYKRIQAKLLEESCDD